MYKTILTVTAIVVSIFILSRCTEASGRERDLRGKAYAGAASCIRCHADIANSYLHTAHLHTSGIVSDSLMHSLVPGGGERFTFPSEAVQISRKSNGYVQSSVQNGKEVTAHRFDVFFGAGRHAYTFASWNGAMLNELPLSYFNAIPGWANSPGYPSSKAWFDRPITERCFECHGSYAVKEYTQEGNLAAKEILNPESIIYGIDCERCHGPAAAHVQFHTDSPQVKGGHYIARWASLSRSQKLDACAVCHSGNDMQMERSTFRFVPGDTLANFYNPFLATKAATPDVHGKQTQLLMASACFKNSTGLQCTSCHDPHHQQNDLAMFSQKCMDCHQPGSSHFCTVKQVSVDVLKKDCISCHMPQQPSTAISFQKAGALQTTPYYLRTHTIAVYPDESAKVMALFQKSADKAGKEER